MATACLVIARQRWPDSTLRELLKARSRWDGFKALQVGGQNRDDLAV